MNLFQKSSFSPDTRIISPLGHGNLYRVMQLEYINNTTNFHSCIPTEEIITLSDEEFSEFKKIEYSNKQTSFLVPKGLLS